MKSIAKEYCSSVKKQMLVYFANWEPTTPIKLGDYGIVEGNVFIKKGNINQKDIKFRVFKDQSKSHKYLTSRGGVKCNFNPQANIGNSKKSVINANLEIEFTNENGFFFNASGCTTTMIVDKTKLGNDIIKLLNSHQWKKEHVIVTDIVEAEKMTLAISGSDNSSILFEATSPLVHEINLADASIELQIKRENAIGYSISTTDKISPLLGLCGIRPRIFGQPDFEQQIKIFPNAVSTFLYATGKASDSATCSSISINNIEDSLCSVRNNLISRSGIEFIGNDLDDGATIEIGDLGLDDIDNIDEIDGFLDNTDVVKIIDLSKHMRENIDKKNKFFVDLGFSKIKRSNSNSPSPFNFGQII